MQYQPAALVLVTVLAGCGRFGFDEGSPDAAVVHDTPDALADVFAATYLKASNADAGDSFGKSVALSADGTTLAVTAVFEASAATTINGDQGNNSAAGAGAAYVFTWSGTAWSQQAYVKAANAQGGDEMGSNVVLSADGNTMAISAYQEDGNGVGGPGNNAAEDAGAVYVFVRSGVTWTQQGYLKASNNDAGDFFGHALAISGDGSTVAVSARNEDSDQTGVGTTGNNDNAPLAGAAYVYARSDGDWTQQAYVKATNTEAADFFGSSVALSASGDRLAVGAGGESSGDRSNPADNSSDGSGAVYVYARTGVTWAVEQYVKADEIRAGARFGRAVALSGSGERLAVGTVNDTAVHVFAREGGAWNQRARLVSADAMAGAGFGSEVAITDDGACIVATLSQPAIGPDAAIVFREAGGWQQTAHLEHPQADPTDALGSVATDATCSVLALGATGEDGGGRGLGADPGDNSAADAGAAYVYRR